MEVRFLVETKQAQETTENDRTNELITEEHTDDNNRKENIDYDENSKRLITHQMQQLNDCETFSEIQIVCSELPSGSLDGYDRYIIGDSLLLCEASIDLYPDDVPHDTMFSLLKFVLMGIACQRVVVSLCMVKTHVLMKSD